MSHHLMITLIPTSSQWLEVGSAGTCCCGRFKPQDHSRLSSEELWEFETDSLEMHPLGLESCTAQSTTSPLPACLCKKSSQCLRWEMTDTAEVLISCPEASPLRILIEAAVISCTGNKKASNGHANMNHPRWRIKWYTYICKSSQYHMQNYIFESDPNVGYLGEKSGHHKVKNE